MLRAKYGIFSVGTIKANRVRDCPSLEDKILTKNGRGSYDMSVDNNQRICIVKWVDNKCVILASTYCEVEPIKSVKRFIKNKSNLPSSSAEPNSSNLPPNFTKSDVTCPNIVSQYNSFMGGVDLSDMLISLYKTPFRSHRWYLTLFAHIIDMCCLNAWLFYKRDCKKLGLKKPLRLKMFKGEIATSLMTKGIMCAPVGTRIPNPIENSRLPLTDCVRFDGRNHFPKNGNQG